MDNNMSDENILKQESSKEIVDEDLAKRDEDIESDDDNDSNILKDITGARGEVMVTSTSSAFVKNDSMNSDSDSDSDDDTTNQFSFSAGSGFSSLNSLASSKRHQIDPSTSVASSSSSSSATNQQSSSVAGEVKQDQEEDDEKEDENDINKQIIAQFKGQNKEATETPPSPADQKNIIQELMTEDLMKLSAGQIWYLVENKWWDTFKNYVGIKEREPISSSFSSSQSSSDPISPGPIDNTEFIINPEAAWQKPPHLVKIQRSAFENYDFVYVPETVWTKISAWYGGGPAVSRNVGITGFARQLNIVNHPYFVFVALHRNKRQDIFHEVALFKTTTIAEVRNHFVKLFKLDSETPVRLWLLEDGKPKRLFGPTDDSKDIELVLMNEIGEKFKLEVKNSDGSWPIQPPTSRVAGGVMHPGGRSSFSNPRMMQTSMFSRNPMMEGMSLRRPYDDDDDDSSSGNDRFSAFSNTGYGGGCKPGMCGLQNLGNTCFMNSGLQCLTKTPQIKNYFTSGDYTKDVNADNPLGMKGKLAQAFGNLMRDMWSGKYSYVSPREFKMVVGQFAPQFSGYNQQDSQELLAYLLDGLHEDLNRVRKKPMTEAVESGGRPDDVVAKEAWDRHLLRNDSVIVDKFQGQLKSTLECPKCNNISITFDPFMYLSLPLPMERTRYITISLFTHDSLDLPTKYALKVSKNGFIKEIKEKLGEKANINPQSIIVCENFSNKIHKVFQDKDLTREIMDRDIMLAFEIPQMIEKPVEVPVKMEDTNSTPSEDASQQTQQPSQQQQQPQQPKYTTINVKIVQKQFSSYTGSTFSSSFRSSNQSSGYTHYSNVGIPFVVPVCFGKTTMKEVYDECLSFFKRYLKPTIKEEFDYDLSNPDSLFPKQKSKKARLSKNDEDDDNDEEMKPTSITPKPSDDSDETKTEDSKVAVSSSSTEDSEMNDSEKPPGLISPPAAAVQSKRPAEYLFTLTLDSGYSNYDAGNTLFYEDIVLNKQDFGDRMYSGKSFAVVIDNSILEKVVDPERIEEVTEDESAKPVQENSTQVKLEDCLQLFSTTEKLGPDDPWYCPKCKEHVQATKKMEIYSLPEVLVIHLKRFQYTRHIRDKIEAMISFPLKGLDMSERNCKKQQAVYDLFAVSNHYGGLGGGHYTAFAKDTDSEKWFRCDDSHVSECSANETQSSAAYVLFYSRSNLNSNQNSDSEIKEENNNNHNNQENESTEN